jgi:hypothetical protein
VLANSFIALKRLGDETTLNSLTALIMGQGVFVTKPVEERLAVLAGIIVQQNDAAVFGSGQLNKLAQAFFDQFSRSYKFSENPTVSMQNWLILAEYLSSPSTVVWLNHQTQASQAIIRELAYAALYNQKTANSRNLLQHAWLDPEPAIQQWAIQCLLQAKQILSKDDYKRILSTPEFRAIAIKTWHEHDYLADPDLLMVALHNQFLSGQNANKSSEIILESNTKANKVKPSMLESICFSQLKELSDFCPSIIFARKLPADQEIATQLLQNVEFPISVRQGVLEKYGADFDQNAMNTLYAIAQIKKDPLRNAVLTKLFAFNSDTLSEFAIKVANNASEQAETRFQAIEFLIRHGHAEAQEILYQ